MIECNKFDVFMEYHTPDSCWVATFKRAGEPFWLDGALVGMEATPSGALQDLIGIALYLVVHGENFLTDGPIPIKDREWLRCALNILTDDTVAL
jgi:hypothetical protein